MFLETTFLLALTLAAWVYLTWGRAGFWRADVWLAPEPVMDPDAPLPSLAVVIPARNEAEGIARTLRSLATQDYRGDFAIWVVDDESTDATAALAEAESSNTVPVTVIGGTPLPQGWSGKVWAMSQGVAAATQDARKPDYILLTDADIEYAPGTLAKLVNKAQANKLNFVSLMARLDARSAWGKLLVPAFIYFFQLIYPFRRTNARDDSLAAAAGGCFLIRREALEAAGGMSTIKGAIIDDCTLAKALKTACPDQSSLTALTHDVRSHRDNRSLDSIWNMVARTAFTQLGYSWPALAGAIAGLVLTFILPVWALLTWLAGISTLAAGALGVAAWLLMARTYLPTVRMYGLNAAWAFSLPAAAVIYAGATLASAWRHARGSGARWKGRSYPAA